MSRLIDRAELFNKIAYAQDKGDICKIIQEMPTFEDHDFGIMCVCAERYALGRRTYIPGIVQEFIKRNVDNIDETTLYVLIRDIQDAEKNGFGYGDETIDKPGWLALLEFLITEYEGRKSNGNTV